MSNSYKHYVITTRPVRKTPGNKIYYEIDLADKPCQKMHFGQYSEMTKKGYAIPGMPTFFDPRNEENDFEFTGTAIPDENIKPKASLSEMLTNIFDALEKSQKDLLFFIFGFDNDFNKELSHVEKLHDAYLNSSDSIGELVMISWPSQGAPWQYFEEFENDVMVTGKALAVFLLKLKTFAEERRQQNKYVPGFHIIIQSMGNRIAEAMAKVLNDSNRIDQLKGLFTRIILMAPDMPNHALNKNSESDYRLLPSLGSRTYVVYSKADKVIMLSKIFHLKDVQLGRHGPDSGFNKEVFVVQIIQKMFDKSYSVSDKSNWFIEGMKNHRYFEYNSKAIEFFDKILSCADGNFEIDNETQVII